MTLYERCVDLQLKVEAAGVADADGALLASGANLVSGIERSSEYFEGAVRFLSAAAVAERPGVDLKLVTKSVNQFRGALSSRGAAAFQQQHATNLMETAKKQRDVVARWIATTWKACFNEYEADITRAQTERLLGDAADQLIARARAQTLRTAMGLDPITDGDDLQRVLGPGEVVDWISAIARTGTELRQALAAIDVAQASLTPEVSEALKKAASETGLPVKELTAELLAALRFAGVDEFLVVRHQ